MLARFLSSVLAVYAAAETAQDVLGIPTWAVDLIKAVPFAGLALLVWRMERKERLEKEAAAQVRYDLLLAQLQEVTKNAITVGQRVVDVLSAAGKKPD